MVFRLDLGQINFNLVKNAIASRQLGFLATSIAFCNILTQACAEIKVLSFWMRKWPTSLGFAIFGIFFSRLSFFSFSFLFAAVIDLVVGLLAVKKLLRKRHQISQTARVEQLGKTLQQSLAYIACQLQDY